VAECVERKALRFLGHKVGPAELALIQEVVGTCGGLSRMELAATVCELLGWKRRTGSLKARECREFLEKLQSQGGLVLPAKRPGRPAGKATEVPVTARGEPGARLVGTARDLGEIRLQRVQRLEQRRLFRELVGRYHYLGHRVPFGAHLRYLVYTSEPAATVVACVQFSSAPAGARGLEQSLFSVALGPGQEPGEPDLIAGRAAAGGGLAPELRGRGVFGGDTGGSGALPGELLSGGELDRAGEHPGREAGGSASAERGGEAETGAGVSAGGGGGPALAGGLEVASGGSPVTTRG
jgi:hypothetical protein